ncbi:hypothetical protein [Micrococcus luteus]|uniref:hypothetical protein n=1 Tax=Micrococcus luteus TaxID=1270 RepID=UPI003790AB4D
MDAKALEPGYTADGQNVSRVGALGHNGILEPGSTAMNNARAFVNGEPVILKENAFTSSMRKDDEKQWDDYEKSDYNEVWPE